MESLPKIFVQLQRQLFPMLEEELGLLSSLDEQFSALLALADLGRFAQPYAWCGNGAPPHARVWLMQAFLAKSVYQFPTTAALREALGSRPTLRRLCGWDSAGEVPSEPTFSRAFAAFAVHALPQRVHALMVQTHAGSKLAGHLSRDATAIAVPERPGPKAAPARPYGRPKQSESRLPPPPKRLDLQATRSVTENLAELPCVCAIGVKRNSQGFQSCWVGYKLHLDVSDGDLPVSAVLTSASVHDNQVAIPLAQLSAQRLISLYDLMDSAYDAPQIRAFSRQLGHVPIIAANRRGSGVVREFEPAHAVRFRERSASERVNSRLKERYGGRWVRVRGGAKVMCHLMFGLIALTAAALFARIV